MPGLGLLRTALSAFSVMFGGLGVFFLYVSFRRPAFGAQALLFLGTATAIALCAPQK